MANKEKLNKIELKDEDLDQVSGGFLGGIWKEEEVTLNVGDVVSIDGLEYVCYHNERNQIFRFIRYLPNAPYSELNKIEYVDHEDFEWERWQIIKRGEIKYLQDLDVYEWY